jgi:hypothetical protein
MTFPRKHVQHKREIKKFVGETHVRYVGGPYLVQPEQCHSVGQISGVVQGCVQNETRVENIQR